MTTNIPDPSLSRRHFLRAGSGAVLAGPAIITAATSRAAEKKANSEETLRIGLIGCGGRGTGAASQALAADYNGRLVAMADVFESQIENSIRTLSTSTPDRVDVKPEKKFVGLDAYQKLLDCGVDVVILATPPGFRPMHLTAAVEAGKHIFCEKPMAVDAVGYRMAVAAVEKAKQKKINLVAGFCWRYDTARRECFKRVKEGQIGDLTGIFATYYTGPVKPMQPASGRKPGMSDVEWQLANWYNFSWLCGDSIVEQAVHSIDKICWAMGDKPPVSCVATGGRQVPSEGGNIFDHFHAAYEWDGGILCHLGSRQIKNCHGENADYIRGTKGQLVIGKGAAPFIDGENRWRYKSKGDKNMYQIEHDELFAAIRSGEVINNGDRMMLSTLTAIMGREAAYTGQKLTWQQMVESQQDLAPETTLKWGDSFTPTPMPQPGVTKFV